ncbi:hypothetical protein [Ectopseudomonas mendocina]|uniref:hypothetical protein n=1 Tax=Ectopseudomonas mendocina TaxID=300 RepID=UPI0023EB2EAF|nr:hypothetical protein [Pseudomonas mendocina]
MQIRVQTYKGKDGRIRQGKTVSLLRYAYDPEKRRSKQVVIGTLDRWATELPPELDSLLTDAERHEFREWIAERDQQRQELAQRHHLLHAAEHMAWAASALEAGVPPMRPERLWEAIDLLSKALEQAGYSKPVRARGRPSKADSPSVNSLMNDPYCDDLLCSDFEEGLKKMAALPDFTFNKSSNTRPKRTK